MAYGTCQRCYFEGRVSHVDEGVFCAVCVRRVAPAEEAPAAAPAADPQLVLFGAGGDCE